MTTPSTHRAGTTDQDEREQFARWAMEGRLWSGSDYLWLNRFHTLYRAYLDKREEVERLRA